MFQNTNLSMAAFFARYAHYLMLCLRAALVLKIVNRFNAALESIRTAAAQNGEPIKEADLPRVEIPTEILAKIMNIDPTVGRSFFNVLAAIGILIRRERGYLLNPDANNLLSEQGTSPLLPYLMLGVEADDSVRDFIDFLRNPDSGTPLYASTGVCAMDNASTALQIASALASRAKRTARSLAEWVSSKLHETDVVLDLGAGSHFLSAKLLENGHQVIITERQNAIPALLQIAEDSGFSLPTSTTDMSIHCYDFFERIALPGGQQVSAIVASNILHDWDLRQAQMIAGNAINCLASNGLFFVHECFLPDDLSPATSPETDMQALAMTAYGMALSHFTCGQGSCYSPREYHAVLATRGLIHDGNPPADTADGCQVLCYRLNR